MSTKKTILKRLFWDYCSIWTIHSNVHQQAIDDREDFQDGDINEPEQPLDDFDANVDEPPRTTDDIDEIVEDINVEED